MDRGTIIKAVRTDRAAFYEVDTDLFDESGTTYRIVDSLAGENTVYLTTLWSHTCISCGSDTAPGLKLLHSDGEGLTAEMLQAAHPSLRIDNAFPHFVHFGDPIPEFSIAAGYKIEFADPAQKKPLQAFLDTCTAEEIDDALIDLEDPDEDIRLVWHDSDPVGYAGYRVWDSGLGDVGILVHRDHRLRGLGVAAVARTTRACLENQRIPFYRTSRDNLGSASIARRVGYQLMWETTAYQW